jgi:hypothetical protein
MLDFPQDETMRKTLQFEFDINCVIDTIDHSNEIIPPDIKLLRAIDTLIEHYSSPKEYNQWCGERDVIIQNMNSKLDPIDKVVW